MPPPSAVAPLAWLALTVQLVSDSTLFSQSMPPPRAVAEALTWLALMTESVIVALPPVVLRPPPADEASVGSGWVFGCGDGQDKRKAPPDNDLYHQVPIRRGPCDRLSIPSLAAPSTSMPSTSASGISA